MKKRPGPRRGRISVLLAAGAAAVFLSSCVRLLPGPPPDDPAAVVERHTLCSEVKETGEWAEPGENRTLFKNGEDGAVFSFLQFRNLQGAHTLAWKWYDPARSLIRASEPVPIGLDGRQFERIVAWDKIVLHDNRDPGFWTVAVLIDGRVAHSRSFEIR